ncbi:MAG: hypothetical protein JST68_06315 [Bacteroidetes bacterium]|nr:hypothetical protein [Bacteroidota bacterium]
MTRLSFIIICLIALLGLAFLAFKGCSGLVSSIDGDKHSKMQHLTGNYYYSQIDGRIWLRDTAIDATTYRAITNNRVDSLSWNDTSITYYSKNKYELIKIASGH